MEAIRIRAVRSESDDADFKRYFGTLLESAPFRAAAEPWRGQGERRVRAIICVLSPSRRVDDYLEVFSLSL